MRLTVFSFMALVLLSISASAQQGNEGLLEKLRALEGEIVSLKDQISKSISPKGIIAAFNLDNCPPGWGEFTGLNGRVIVGAGQGVGLSARTRGDTGGAESVILSIDQMPSHHHGIQLGNNTRTGPDDWVQHADPRGGIWPVGNTKNTGGNAPTQLMQPYFVLKYCQRQ